MSRVAKTGALGSDGGTSQLSVTFGMAVVKSLDGSSTRAHLKRIEKQEGQIGGKGISD